MMKKPDLSARLCMDLETVIAARAGAAVDECLAARGTALRLFQAERMARTRADYLQHMETYPAARFFCMTCMGRTT
jgi:hypothetical protein